MTALAAPLPYADDIEVVPSDEAADIEIALDLIRKVLRDTQERTREFRRDVHVKSHGCVTGTLEVLPNLPPELAQGLFAREETYDAVVRFSNGANEPQSDLVPDARGMAVKLRPWGEPLTEDTIGVQDFVLINQPIFFAANVKDFIRWERILAADKNNSLSTAAETITGGSWNPFDWRWREASAVARLSLQPPQHPARQTYYSASPIRYGAYVAKVRCLPTGEISMSLLQMIERFAVERDAMRHLLAESLQQEPLRFEVQVQLRTSAESMPIEDASVEWPERESPYRSVALLTLPMQEVGSSVPRELGENLAFDVWNSPAEHRPLGGINRLRRVVYPTSVRWRGGTFKS